jgi:HAMP domain-containing protein
MSSERRPHLATVGAGSAQALAVGSTLLYFVAACYFVIAAVTEGPVQSGDKPLTIEGGMILATAMLLFGLICLSAFLIGRRQRRRGRTLEAITSHLAGAALGLIPLYGLFQ